MAKSKSKKNFSMNDEAFDAGVLDILDNLSFSVSDEAAAAPSAGLSAQVDEVVQGLSGSRKSTVYQIDVRRLEPFPNQPFHPYPQAQLDDLTEDIRRVGILSPILARQKGNSLQILAGHNRWRAAKLAGLSDVPVIIMEADDDQAILILTSTNLRQRERLLPSEKAFAYKLQMEALKRQGAHLEDGYSAASFITAQTGDSRVQIHRYVRLTQLDQGLLELLDRGKISMTPAVALSYLTPDDQAHVLALLRDFGAHLTIDRANKLKTLAQEHEPGPIGNADIDALFLSPNSAAPRRLIRLRYEKISQYLPAGLDTQQAEEYIITALRAYQK